MSEKKHETRLIELMMGLYYSRGLYCAASLKLADHLKDGPRNAAELAELTECDPGVLYRLMRALTTVDVFEQDGDKFSLTPISELLRSDDPRRLLARTLVVTGEWENWAKLPEVVKTGKTPERDYDGLKPDEDEEMSAIFDDAMDSFYYDAPAPMLGIYDFSDAKTVCDVGGGSGNQLAALLKAYPDMQGMLFDLPETIENRGKPYMAAEGLTDRCRFIAGDFFEAIPAGADVYMMRHIIHNWDDERCVTILANTAEVLPENGKVLVVDWAITPDKPKTFNKWWDLMNLLFAGGAERTPEEHAALFEKAGLKYTRYIPAKLETSVIEGVKA